MTLGWLLCDAGRTDEGIEELRKTLEMDPTFVIAHHRLAVCYERKGAYDGAITEYQKVIDLGAKVLGTAGLGQAYAIAGKRSEAQKELAELQELSKHRNAWPSLFALIYAALGDRIRLSPGSISQSMNMTWLQRDLKLITDSITCAPIRASPIW